MQEVWERRSRELQTCQCDLGYGADHLEYHPMQIVKYVTIGVIRSSQHVFLKGRSCRTDLISFYDKMICLGDEGNVDVIYLDFSKLLDTIPQYSPGETGCSWLGQVCSLLREELAGWRGSESPSASC